MDFEGIYLWDARYGVPKEGEDIDLFIEGIEYLPESQNINLQKFGEFIASFAKQASEFYADPILEDYIDYSLAGEVWPLVKLELEDMPFNKEVVEHFLAAFFKGAKDNQLIIYDIGAESFLLPSSNEGDILYDNWLEHLKKLKNNEVLPTNKSQFNKLMLKMFKERAKELGIKLNKSGGHFDVDFGAITIAFYIFLEIEEGKAYVWPFVNIVLNNQQIGELEVSYVKFHQMDYDWHKKKSIPTGGNSVRHTYLLINDMHELKIFVNNSLDMVMFFYPHCESLESLYDFLTTQKDDPRLARGYVNGVEHMAPDILCALAKLTKQPNYEVLKEKYLQQYIEDHQYHDYEWERREALVKEQVFNYKQDERKSNSYLTKEFIFIQERLRFYRELIDTKEEIINYLELDYFLGYGDSDIVKACLEILKISDIGAGPYFVRCGSIYEDHINQAMQYKPEDGKLLVITINNTDECRALVESYGGVFLSCQEFLENY